MILTVLVLSSAVLSLSAIGGYMMLVRLRISSDIANTTKAIYIADAGLECAAYAHYTPQAADFCTTEGRNEFRYVRGTADLDASYEVEDVVGPPQYIRSKGSYRSASRSFRLDFE